MGKLWRIIGAAMKHCLNAPDPESECECEVVRLRRLAAGT